jgi:hypothetical protein
MNAPSPSLRIGVALGGGAAQGFAHVTVLEAIDGRPQASAFPELDGAIGGGRGG